MTRYVITPEIAVELAGRQATIASGVQLVAPTLLRSQVLSTLYQRVRQGDLTKPEARAHLDYIRGLRIRLLGDRVLQNVAWDVAVELDWPDTLAAEYIALTKLQADALITHDAQFDAAAALLVTIGSFDDLVE